jgi:hypothetical protein
LVKILANYKIIIVKIIKQFETIIEICVWVDEDGIFLPRKRGESKSCRIFSINLVIFLYYQEGE